MTDQRKDEIRELATNAINWMGSRFFRAQIELDTEEEAIYASRLWNSHREGLVVTYFTRGCVDVSLS